MTSDLFLRMTPLELASGWVTGYDEKKEGAGLDSRPGNPLAVLELSLLEALQLPPCLVEFSGGRDSSVLLAIAAKVARREGLPLPIPITRFFPDAPETNEGEWPELVVSFLGLTDWVRLQIHDELDLLGPLAADGLRRHGVLWPVTIHTKVLTYEHARGGTLISGEGGDEVFGPRRITPLTRMLAGARPRRRGIKPVAAALSPRRVRRIAVERGVRQKAHRPWLQPEAQEAFLASLVNDMLQEPLRWSASIRLLSLRRAWTVGKHNLSVLASLHNVRYLHPFLDETVLRAVSSGARILGYPTRTEAMRALFGGILPKEVIARETKAWFNQAHIRRYTAEFVASWDGTGLDGSFVDATKLRAEWNEPHVSAASFPLLVQAWLSSQA